MTSHTGYWSNPDVAYFILTQIFPELEENFELNVANASPIVASSSSTIGNSSSAVIATTSGGACGTVSLPSSLSPEDPFESDY